MATDAQGNPVPPNPAEFAEALINPTTLLSSAVEWINDNMNPADVFDHAKLAEWAQQRGFRLLED